MIVLLLLIGIVMVTAPMIQAKGFKKLNKGQKLSIGIGSLLILAAIAGVAVFMTEFNN